MLYTFINLTNFFLRYSENRQACAPQLSATIYIYSYADIYVTYLYKSHKKFPPASRKQTGLRTAAIGDGGNDVAMIQAADAGIGLEGKEGRQASLAADFSLTQFCHIGRLCLVHGRYSYKRWGNL